MRHLSELIVLVFILNFINCNEYENTYSIEVDPKFCEDMTVSTSGNEIQISIHISRFKRFIDIPCYKMINGRCLRISQIKYSWLDRIKILDLLRIKVISIGKLIV